MKKRKIGLLSAAIVLVCMFVLWESGTIGLLQKGLAFMMHDSRYHISYANVDSAAETEIDLYNLQSNSGKVIYDDGECKIEIELVKHEDNGTYNIFFRTHGTYNRSGGTLISAVKQIRKENGTYSLECAGKMQVVVDDKVYEGKNSAWSSLIYKDGDEFGFFLFPLECYENGQLLIEDQIKNQNGKIKIQLSQLTKTTWIKSS